MTTVQTLLILGASGDLTERFLLPAVGRLLEFDSERELELIGSSRHDKPEWAELVRRSFARYAGRAVERTLASARWVTADATDADDWADLLAEVRGELNIYFAIGPQVARKVCEALREVHLPDRTRLIMEKPFGNDAESAVELNGLLQELVGEDRVFRVDHFLGLPAVAGMPGLRGENPVLAALWNGEHVEAISVIWDETLGLEDRADFYDRTGALRDMVQSHLLQVLAAILCADGPAADRAAGVSEALASLTVTADSPRRARWTAGEIDGVEMRDYTEEDGVDPARRTETLVQIELASSLPQWAGVRMLLRSGKGLADDRHLVELDFGSGNKLRFQLRTGAAELCLNGSDPDTGEQVGIVMSGENPDVDPDTADEATYMRVLRAALDGDHSMAVTAQAAVRCWEVVAPVVAAFEADQVELEEYPAGSDGPERW